MKNFKVRTLVAFLIFIVILINGKGVFAKYILETSKVLIIETNLDRTPPKLNISYSTTEFTNGNVTVTIKSNEKIKNKDGWTISEDKLSLIKVFETNTSENVEICDLAGNLSVIKININNIDKIKPKVECIEIKNSNTSYPLYANSQKEINLTIKLTDNIQIKDIDVSKITIKVGEKLGNLTKQCILKSSSTKERIYNLKLTNIQADGVLTVNFENGFTIDMASNNNDKTSINTQINIDNTKPNIVYSQKSINEGKVQVILTANEKVKPLNGWNIATDSKKLSKEFVSNVSYELSVQDLAGNSTVTGINVTGATYINLIYASHNSNIGWLYGFGNFDIAGKESVLLDSNYKTEALAFNITGNIESDFVKGRAFVHHFWGENKKGKCGDSGMLYEYGYNPSQNSWKTMESKDLVTINGKKYFQFRRSWNKWKWKYRRKWK